MSDSKKPFTEHVTRANRRMDTSTIIWIGAGIAGAALVAAALWLAPQQAKRDSEALLAKLREANTALSAAQADNAKLQEQITALKTQVGDLEREKEQTAQMAKSLETEMTTALQSKDVTISNLKGRLTVNILDRILFDSGEAVVKPDGEAVLRKIAALLAAHPQLKIHVIGHTDNVPIRANARSRFASNWELSTARALAAVRFLTERAGVDPRRLGAVGYGEFRPIADNSTPEGRAKNRRIAITILPDELAGADATPAAPAAHPPGPPPAEPAAPPGQ